MATKPHFPFHEKEFVINRQRFVLLNAIALAVIVSGVGMILMRASQASGPPPVVTLTLNGQNSDISVPQGAFLSVSWSSVNAPTSCTSSWQGAVGTSGSANRSADTSTVGVKTYSVQCSNAGGSGSAAHSVTVGATPTPPPPAPKPSPKPNTPPVMPPAAPPSAPADNQPPAAPARFSAVVTELSVSLNWEASSDDVALAGYVLERSLNQKDWQQLGGTLTDNKYRDDDISFGKHYYYRLHAIDASGKSSAVVTADVLTGSFSANVSSGSGNTLNSSDGKATATIPPGATDADTQCNLLDGDTPTGLSDGLTNLAGPYDLICKKSNGESVAQFSKAISLAVVMSEEQAKKYSMKLRIYDGAKRQFVVQKAKYNSKNRTFNYSPNTPVQFLVAGSVKNNYWPTILSILLVIFLIGGGALSILLRRRQKARYQQYLRSKYYNF